MLSPRAIPSSIHGMRVVRTAVDSTPHLVQNIKVRIIPDLLTFAPERSELFDPGRCALSAVKVWPGLSLAVIDVCVIDLLIDHIWIIAEIFVKASVPFAITITIRSHIICDGCRANRSSASRTPVARNSNNVRLALPVLPPSYFGPCCHHHIVMALGWRWRWWWWRLP